jgi:hypothetical protein
MPPKRKEKIGTRGGDEMNDVRMEDGGDDRVIVMDAEVAVGLQQDEWGGMDGDREMGLPSQQEGSEDDIEDITEDDNDNQVEGGVEDDNDSQVQDGGAASGGSANQTVANDAQQRDQAMHDLQKNWGCTTIQDAFPPKPDTWLKGCMDMEKKRFKLRDFHTEKLLLLQQLSFLTVGKSKEIKEKMAAKWHYRNHNETKRVGGHADTKQRNLREDLQELYDDAEKENAESERKRKASHEGDKGIKRARVSDDDDEDEDAEDSAKPSTCIVGSTIQTRKDRNDALKEIYASWGIDTLVGHFPDNLYKAGTIDDTDLDAGVIELLRGLSRITNTREQGEETRLELQKSLWGVKEFDREDVLPRLQHFSHPYFDAVADAAAERRRQEHNGSSMEDQDAEAAGMKQNGKAPATRARGDNTRKLAARPTTAQDKAGKRGARAQSQGNALLRRHLERVAANAACKQGQPEKISQSPRLGTSFSSDAPVAPGNRAKAAKRGDRRAQAPPQTPNPHATEKQKAPAGRTLGTAKPVREKVDATKKPIESGPQNEKREFIVRATPIGLDGDLEQRPDQQAPLPSLEQSNEQQAEIEVIVTGLPDLHSISSIPGPSAALAPFLEPSAPQLSTHPIEPQNPRSHSLIQDTNTPSTIHAAWAAVRIVEARVRVAQDQRVVAALQGRPERQQA